MNNYKVSVIVPCYNAEKWIEECISSIFEQTYDNYEVIVIDNESQDKSVSILKSLQTSGLDFTLSSAPNIYPHCWDEARAVGFKLATGEYFLTMCADDYLDPDFLENCVGMLNLINEHWSPSVMAATPLALQSPIKGVKSDEYYVPYFSPMQGHMYTTLEEFKNHCLHKCPVNTPSVLYHRSLYERGLLETKPEKYGGAADYDLYCRLADNNVFIYPSPNWLGYNYRWHPEQATWGVIKSGANYDAKIQQYWRERWGS